MWAYLRYQSVRQLPRIALVYPQNGGVVLIRELRVIDATRDGSLFLLRNHVMLLCSSLIFKYEIDRLYVNDGDLGGCGRVPESD